jgi:hypothetical protein
MAVELAAGAAELAGAELAAGELAAASLDPEELPDELQALSVSTAAVTEPANTVRAVRRPERGGPSVLTRFSLRGS